MDDITRKNFRDHVTRVSFNLSLTRNQIAVLVGIRNELGFSLNEMMARKVGYRQIREKMGDTTNMFLPGSQALMKMGLVEHAPFEGRISGDERHDSWRLTEAGKLTIRMLELAGLIPEMIAANSNSSKKRKKLA